MKKLKTALLIILSFLTVCSVPSCSCSGDGSEEESSAEENASVVSELSEDISEEEESKKDESSKSKVKEASKPKEVSKEESKGSSGPSYLEPDLDSSREILSDFSSYLSQNPDTVGWINVPYTAVNYVVVQSPGDMVRVAYSEDPYYLYRDFYGNYLFSGSIFLDYRSKLGSKNLLLHGHSMADGTKFAGILSYSSLDFYKSAPVISFNSLYEKAKWKIIAVIKVNTDKSQGDPFHYLRGSFSSNYDFLNFVYELRMRSIIDCPVDVNENDTLITLSTCAYDFSGFRQAIIARKVREGEDSKVAVSKARYNSNPLYPDVWYWYRGGTKPTVTSFQDALNKKQITWYDGKQKWSAKDDKKLKEDVQKMMDGAEKKIRDTYKPEYYSQGQIDNINNIINIFMEAIREAKDTTRINDLTKQTIALIADIPPDNKEKYEAIVKARSEALTAIKNVVKGKKYRQAQQEKVNKLISEYTEKINASQDLDMIAVMRKNAVSLLGKIQTDAQLKEKEKSSSKKT